MTKKKVIVATSSEEANTDAAVSQASVNSPVNASRLSKETHIKVKPVPATETGQESGNPDATENGKAQEHPQVDPEVAKVMAEQLIGVACTILNTVLTLITKMPELELTDDEQDELVNAWTPVLPTGNMTPLTAALVCTIMIFGSKFAIYMALQKKRSAVPAKVNPNAEGKVPVQ